MPTEENNNFQTPTQSNLTYIAFRGQKIFGTISSHDENLGLMCFQLDDEHTFSKPKINQKMRLSSGDSTSFTHTILLDISHDRWILSLPKKIDLKAQRTKERFVQNSFEFFSIVSAGPTNTHEAWT